MSFPRRKIGELDQRNLSRTRMRKFHRDFFGQTPLTAAAIGYGDPTGATGDINRLLTESAAYEYHIKGAGQTLLAPSWDAANGLLISLDLTDDEGAEYTAGIGALSSGSFTIGTDRDFYAKATLKLADVSGTDEFLFGFRKNQAYQTVHTDYTDYAAIGIFTAANPADVQIKTRLNSGTAALLDTTKNWADGETHTLQVSVKQDGKCRFLFDDAEPPATRTDFAFDPGDSVNWFLFGLHATTTPGAWHSTLFEWGFLPLRGE